MALEPAFDPKTLSEQALRQADPGQALIGIDYNDSYYGTNGGTYSYYVNNADGCTTGYGYGMDTMPGGWNNIVSSADPYTGCNTWWHYDYSYHPSSSPKIDCSPCGWMGAMDNATSSEEWGP